MRSLQCTTKIAQVENQNLFAGSAEGGLLAVAVVVVGCVVVVNVGG